MAGARGRGVERFRATLDEHGLADTIVELAAGARTADDAAAALGCPAAAIVKSLVLAGAQARALLVLGAGDGRLDEALVGAHAGGPVHLADAGFVREVAGFAIGGVPPFGHERALRTLVDERILEQPRVWAAAGAPHALFSLAPTDLVAATRGEVVAVGRP